MLRGASMGLGVQSMLDEVGLEMDIELNSDSSAARGIAKRAGLGKTRHLDVCHLWLQAKVADQSPNQGCAGNPKCG